MTKLWPTLNQLLLIGPIKLIKPAIAVGVSLSDYSLATYYFGLAGLTLLVALDT